MHVPVQRLQHQPVAAERHHDVGTVGVMAAVELDELLQRRLRLGAGARDEGDFLVSLGHGYSQLGASQMRRGVVYTAWLSLSR